MTEAANNQKRTVVERIVINIVFATLAATPTLAQQFTPGNVVVAVSGCGVQGGTCTSVPNGTGVGTGNSSIGGYGDNQASPLTLFQFAPTGTTSATYVNSLVLPQSSSGANLPVSAEYGSNSEGTLQLSGDGRYLTIMGYGIDAPTFDKNPAQYGAAPSLALAQSGSLTTQNTYTPVARVAALIDANGNVNSSTALLNVFDTNNPRSIFTQDGTVAYVSGQGTGADATGGVFYTPLSITNTAPTPITGLDTTPVGASNTYTVSQDTREVQIVNNTLYVSVDSKGGSNMARSYIGTLGNAGTPPIATVGGPVMLTGYGNTGGTGKVTITTGPNSNGNGPNAGLQINTSPNNFFFANASTLYVADGGNPKNNSATSTIGDGGLQKWINTAVDGSGTWNLAYTLTKGLNLVSNKLATGTTGLYGLAGRVVGGSVQLFATDYVLADLDPTNLYGVTDTLNFTTASQAAAETFATLAKAPADSYFKGVSFTPTAVQTSPATPANLVVTRSLTRTGGNIVVMVTIANTGGTAAANVTLTGVKVGTATASVLPQTLGAIAAGASAQTTVSVPGTIGVSGSASSLTVAGTSAGGSFNSSARISLP